MCVRAACVCSCVSVCSQPAFRPRVHIRRVCVSVSVWDCGGGRQAGREAGREAEREGGRQAGREGPFQKAPRSLIRNLSGCPSSRTCNLLHTGDVCVFVCVRARVHNAGPKCSFGLEIKIVSSFQGQRGPPWVANPHSRSCAHASANSFRTCARSCARGPARSARPLHRPLPLPILTTEDED